MNTENKPTKVIVLPVTECQGASINVPADCLSLYSQLRTEQLRTLTDLLHCKMAGFDLQLTDSDVSNLTGLVNQLAAEANAICNHYAYPDEQSGKDGAA